MRCLRPIPGRHIRTRPGPAYWLSTVTQEDSMRHILTFDTETTTDTTQALNFGSWRIYELTAKGYLRAISEEGLFYADDLPERDPEGLSRLREYSAGHRAPISHRITSRAVAVSRIACMSQSEFIEK